MDSGAADALDGGVATSGGMCDAIAGAAIAAGMLAERRGADRATAKRLAHGVAAGTLNASRGEYGSVDCRALTGDELRAPGGQQPFLEGDVWRDACMPQIEFVVSRLSVLRVEDAWAHAERRLQPSISDRRGT